MTNFEKYREEILKITESGNTFAMPRRSQALVECTYMSCCDCIFYCSRCLSGRIRWLYEEAVEPAPTLTAKERAFCEIIRDGYIARDRDGSIWVFNESPHESNGIWT